MRNKMSGAENGVGWIAVKDIFVVQKGFLVGVIALQKNQEWQEKLKCAPEGKQCCADKITVINGTWHVEKRNEEDRPEYCKEWGILDCCEGYFCNPWAYDHCTINGIW